MIINDYNDYEKQVKLCAEENSPFIFGNSSTEHSLLILREFLHKAERYFYMISFLTELEFYLPVLFEELKEKKIEVKIIVFCDSSDDVVAVAKKVKKELGQIDIKIKFVQKIDKTAAVV